MYFRARYFTCIVGSSFKFWTIRMNPDKSYTVRFGRIGTSGQLRTKHFETQWEAQKAAGRIIQQKMEKGYVENGVAVGDLPEEALMVLAKVVSVSRKKSSPAKKRKTAKKAVPVGRVISFEKEE